MRGLRAALLVVGFLLLLGVSYPLLAFVMDLRNGKSKIFTEVEGNDLALIFDYHGSVELTDVALSVTFKGQGREVTRSASSPLMRNGSTLTIKIDVSQLPRKISEVAVTMNAKIGGIFPLAVSRTMAGERS